MPAELVAFLDLVAELIAATLWQGSCGSAAQGETGAFQPEGQAALLSSETGNVGPIPTFPADSHPRSRSSPTTPGRATRRASPEEGS